jgi:hypothetical protein
MCTVIEVIELRIEFTKEAFAKIRLTGGVCQVSSPPQEPSHIPKPELISINLQIYP